MCFKNAGLHILPERINLVLKIYSIWMKISLLKQFRWKKEWIKNWNQYVHSEITNDESEIMNSKEKDDKSECNEISGFVYLSEKSKEIFIIFQVHGFRWNNVLADTGGVLRLWLSGSIISFYAFILFFHFSSHAKMLNVEFHKTINPPGITVWYQFLVNSFHYN